MAVRQAGRVGYVELVTDFFLEVRGGGLLLSPVDVALIRRWQDQGLPVEVVCRGIQAGLESHQRAHPGLPAPARLAYYAPAVAEALRAAREKAVGRSDDR